jgi:hypothetical protein
MKKHTWFQLSSHPEVYYGQYLVPNFMSNSIAINTSDNHWVLLSPGEKMLKSFLESLNDENIMLSIIFPNAFHYLGADAWLERFPEAKLYASKKAKKRLAKKGFKRIIALENEQPELPEGYEVLMPPGHRGGDAWLSKQGGEGANLWITCDSFLNYDRVSKQPIARALQSLLGAAPGLKISQVIKWLLLDRKAKFKPWVLNQLQKDKPTILIPGHGEVDSGPELTERLRLLIETRL